MDARYRLAPVRELRARHERVQRADVASALREARDLAGGLDQIADRVAQTRAAIAAALTTRDQALAGGIASTTLAQFEHHLRRLRRDLEAARGELWRAEARHEAQLDLARAAQDRLALARAERQVIERHFAAWRAKQRKRAERRAD